MSGRRTRSGRCGVRVCWRVVGLGVAGLLAGACSGDAPVQPAGDPVADAAVVESLVRVPTLTAPAAAPDPLEEAVSAEAAPSATVSVPSTTEVSAPTSTWVVFEEVEEPPAPRVFDRVRVPQSEGDAKGAFFYYPGVSTVPGSPPKRFDHAGAVFDLCRVEDAYFGTYGWHPDEGGVPDEYRRDWFRGYSAPGDCRGSELALVRPLLNLWPERYFTFDDGGSKSPSFASAQEAEEWYAAAVAGYGENSIPAGMLPVGVGAVSNPLTGYGRGFVPEATEAIIEYSDVADLLDVVRVLPGTVALGGDGVLRGMVRNWSRSLWAYGAVVSADGREWAWPLSIQPGETAPFEIGGWDGPADAALIDFAVTAEMSNDADLSRAWFFHYDAYYALYYREEHYGEPPPEDQYIFKRLRPWSHPGLEGQWERSLELGLSLHLAELNPDGTVAKVRQPSFSLDGFLREKQPHESDDYVPCDPSWARFCYPHSEQWVERVIFRLDPSEIDAFQVWVGMPHPRAGQ